MALQLDWDSYWSIYEANPEMLQDDLQSLPDFLKHQSARVQFEVVRHAPKHIVKSLLPCLTMDCQIRLLER